MICATWGILSGFAGRLSEGSVIILAVATAFHAALYILPDRFIAQRNNSRLLLAAFVNLAVALILPSSFNAQGLALIAIAIALAVPLVWQRVTVWTGTAALVMPNAACPAAPIALDPQSKRGDELNGFADGLGPDCPVVRSCTRLPVSTWTTRSEEWPPISPLTCLSYSGYNPRSAHVCGFPNCLPFAE